MQAATASSINMKIKAKDRTLTDENGLSGLMINELLQVQVPVPDDGNPGVYRSRVEDIVEEKLMVAWPSDGRMRMPLHQDQILSFSLVRDNNAYSFNGMVDGMSEKPLPLVTIIISSAIERVQRRQDFRVKCLIPVEIIGTLPVSSGASCPVILRLKTHASDLSASGISVSSEVAIPTNIMPEIRFSLPDDKPLIKILCRVTHCFAIPGNSTAYHSGIQFLDINEKDKARIVRFVYRTQLQGLRSCN